MHSNSNIDLYLLNKKFTDKGINIWRPFKWGNQYRFQEYGRRKSVELYEEHLVKSRLIEDIEELHGFAFFVCTFVVPWRNFDKDSISIKSLKLNDHNKKEYTSIV